MLYGIAESYLTPEEKDGPIADAMRKQFDELLSGHDVFDMNEVDFGVLEDSAAAITEKVRQNYTDAANSPEYAELKKAEEEWAKTLMDPKRTEETIRAAAEKVNASADTFNVAFGAKLGFDVDNIDNASIASEIEKMNALYEAVLPDANTFTLNGEATGEAYVKAMLSGITEAVGKGGNFTEVYDKLLEDMKESLDPEQFADFSDALSSIFGGANIESLGGMDFAEFSEQIEEATAATAKSLSDLFNAMEEEGDFEPTVETMEDLYEILEKEDGLEQFKDMWSALSDEAQKELKKIAPELEDLYEKIEEGSGDGEEAMEKLNRTIAKMKLDELEDAGKILDGTADTFEAVTKEGANAEKEIGGFISSIAELKAAQEAYNYCIRDGASKMADYDTHMQTLASYAGVPVEALGDLSSVANMLSTDLLMAGNSAGWLLNMMSSVAGVQLNTANWQSQLQAAADSGNVCAAAMLTLISYLQGIDGTIVNMVTAADGQSAKFNVSGLGSGVKLPKVSTPKKSSGGSGGSGKKSGGGGSSSIEVSSAITEMIEKMEKALDLIDFNIELMQVAQEMHEVSGEIQGVILYTEKEIEVTTKQRDALKEYITELEAEMAAKEKIMASNKATSKAYKQANVDLEELNEKHQELTLEYYESEIALKELTKALEEYRIEALEKVTAVQDLIYEAIEDREALEESMLEGRIDLENEILELLTERYEKERDEILETQELKRDALEEEMDLLDEMLDKRKEAADLQNKENEIALLEAKIARISADPTRKKEELELRKELAELREEMAWETAENEVEAQKDALQQQIDSIDEYMEYVEKYYEDLFENPKKLIEEMQQIIQGTDEEIMNWLQENSEEFRESTEATQESMTASWQETLNEMRGITETYWDEVAEIMKDTDEEIIAFLKEHNEDFKNASSEQADIFVSEWKTALEEWRAAYKAASDSVSSYNYAPTTPVSGGGSGGGGGSSGGGSSGSTASKPAAKKTYYRYAYKKVDGTWVPMGTYDSTEKAAFERAQKGGQNYWQMLANSGQLKQSAVDNFKNLIASATISNPGKYIKFSDTKQFKTGGMADFTGPAWLDGTKSKPERILSSYQTELFEDLLKTLHAIKMMRVNLPSVNTPEYSRDGGYGVNIERIDITTNSLTDDEDFDEITRRVGEAIEAAMMKGSTVGGIRVRRG